MKKIYILCLFRIMSFGTTLCMHEELVRATRIQNRFERLSKEYIRVANDGLAQDVKQRSYGLLRWNNFCQRQLEYDLYADLMYEKLDINSKKQSIAYRKKLRGRMAVKRV